MPNNLTFTEFVQSLLPKGALWKPRPPKGGYTFVVTKSGEYVVTKDGKYVVIGNDEDRVGFLQLLISGIGDNAESLNQSLQALAYIRDPMLTPILSDLEKEYGIITDETKPEEDRRIYLRGIKYARAGLGDLDYLQTALQNAGFDVQVHANNLATNPLQFYGGYGGILIVNKSSDETEDPAGMAITQRWNYTFFVGGDATRSEDGQIISIDRVLLTPDEQKAMAKIILKHKPLHSWCVAIVTNNDYFTLSSSDNWETSSTQGFDTGFWYGEI